MTGGSEAINAAIAESLGGLPDHNSKMFIGVDGHCLPFLDIEGRKIGAYQCIPICADLRSALRVYIDSAHKNTCGDCHILRKLSGEHSLMGIEVASQDSGQETYTALGQIAARELQLQPDQVTVVMGDSRLPAGPASSNSLATASLGSAVKLATDKICAHFGGSTPCKEDGLRRLNDSGLNELSELGEFLLAGKKSDVLKKLRTGQVPFAIPARGDESTGKPLMFAFGAEICGGSYPPLTREIRTPRMTGAFAAGRMPRTARSQFMCGMIWGMVSALLEATESTKTSAATSIRILENILWL